MFRDNPTYWTYAQVSLLWELAKNNAPVQEISFRVGKPYAEVCRKATELGIALPADSPVQRFTAARHSSSP